MASMACFAPAPVGVSLRKGRTTVLPTSGLKYVCARPVSVAQQPNRRARVTMGLFGLGFPEIAVIAAVGVLVFGPGKIAELSKDLGKDLGSFAGGVKTATSEFQDAMEESIAEADEKIERKKIEKEAAGNQTVDAAATPVEIVQEIAQDTTKSAAIDE